MLEKPDKKDIIHILKDYGLNYLQKGQKSIAGTLQAGTHAGVGPLGRLPLRLAKYL